VELRNTVYVVDDDHSMRRALVLLLTSVGVEVEEFETAEEFLEGCDPERAGCLVLDVRMPGMSGLDLQRELAARSIDLPIIFITGHGDVPMGVRAMKQGAVDFLQKPFNDQQLIDAVREGLNADLERRKARAIQAEALEKLASLTAREREVMELVVAGLTNKEVGARLGAAEKTIKIHRSRVMHKMGARSLPELVRLAQDAGMEGGGDSV
jgi:two-component system response regulator FixJ